MGDERAGGCVGLAVQAAWGSEMRTGPCSSSVRVSGPPTAQQDEIGGVAAPWSECSRTAMET